MARERGQATIETVAVLPLVLGALLAAAQGLTAAWAAVEAADAARAGARAALVGGDPAATARAALPHELRHGARIAAGRDGRVRVDVVAPPGWGTIRVTGEAG
jgi:pilus assembly protein CpaE